MCVYLYLSKFLWQSDTQIDTQRTHPHSIYATSITATVKWANPFQFPWSTANAKFHFYLIEAKVCVGAKLIVASLKAIFQIQSGLKNGQTLYSGQRIYKWFYPYDSFFSLSLCVFNNIILLSLVDFCFVQMVRISSHQIHCLLPIANSEYKYFNRCFFFLHLFWNETTTKSSWKTGTTQRLNYFC